MILSYKIRLTELHRKGFDILKPTRKTIENDVDYVYS